LIDYVEEDSSNNYEFLIENISRWLAYQKEYSWDNISVLEALTKYVSYT
jgi:hypothetical protein